MSERDDLGQRDYMSTISGEFFSLSHPTTSQVDWYDIAHSLAMLPRYGGHTPYPYPVGQHSILMARMAHEDNLKADEIAAILLHDAAEAYIGDIISPVKRWFYDVIAPREMKILEVIFETADLKPVDSYKAVIEYYDAQLFVEEVLEFFPKTADDPRWNLPDMLPRRPRFKRYTHSALRSAFLRELDAVVFTSGVAHRRPDAASALFPTQSSFAHALGLRLREVEGDWDVLVPSGLLLTGKQINVRYTYIAQRPRILGIIEEFVEDLGYEPWPIKIMKKPPVG